MTNPIDTLMVYEGPSVFYDYDFKVVLESHLTFLREHPDTTITAVTPNDAYRFEGDLYGLLNLLNIGAQYHWIIMRINDMTSPQESPVNLPYLKMPSISAIEGIRQLFMITHKIS